MYVEKVKFINKNEFQNSLAGRLDQEVPHLQTNENHIIGSFQVQGII